MLCCFPLQGTRQIHKEFREQISHQLAYVVCHTTPNYDLYDPDLVLIASACHHDDVSAEVTEEFLRDVVLAERVLESQKELVAFADYLEEDSTKIK